MQAKCILIPAYGRQYTTVESLKNAFEKGLDFKILNGSYCSIRDIEEIKKIFGQIELSDLRNPTVRYLVWKKPYNPNDIDCLI